MKFELFAFALLIIALTSFAQETTEAAEAQTTGRCQSDEFQCDDGYCKLHADLCNNRDICFDDQIPGDCAPCGEGDFVCNNGQCVKNWSDSMMCNDDADCQDYTDEEHENCTKPCPPEYTLVGDACYKYIIGSVSYADAMIACGKEKFKEDRMHAGLPVFKDYDDWKILKDAPEFQSITYWISGNYSKSESTYMVMSKDRTWCPAVYIPWKNDIEPDHDLKDFIAIQSVFNTTDNSDDYFALDVGPEETYLALCQIPKFEVCYISKDYEYEEATTADSASNIFQENMADATEEPETPQNLEEATTDVSEQSQNVEEAATDASATLEEAATVASEPPQDLEEASTDASTTLGEVECTDDNFSCLDGKGQCIDNGNVCNGNEDCTDKSDESLQTCPRSATTFELLLLLSICGPTTDAGADARLWNASCTGWEQQTGQDRSNSIKATMEAHPSDFDTDKDDELKVAITNALELLSNLDDSGTDTSDSATTKESMMLLLICGSTSDSNNGTLSWDKNCPGWTQQTLLDREDEIHSFINSDHPDLNTEDRKLIGSALNEVLLLLKKSGIDMASSESQNSNSSPKHAAVEIKQHLACFGIFILFTFVRF